MQVLASCRLPRYSLIFTRDFLGNPLPFLTLMEREKPLTTNPAFPTANDRTLSRSFGVGGYLIGPLHVWNPQGRTSRRIFMGPL